VGSQPACFSRLCQKRDKKSRAEGEHCQIESELANLATAIATAGGPPKTLVAAIKTRESQLERLRSGLAQLAGRTRVGRLDQQRYRETVLKRLCDWQSLVGRHVADARRILRSLLEGRIAFTPRSAGDETWYEFAGQASLARVLTGVVSTKGLVAPTGFAT